LVQRRSAICTASFPRCQEFKRESPAVCLKSSSELAAHPYKLLVYEKGGFFLPHRDGEKLDAMVATLVICLPSVHKGGALIVSHEGQQREILMDGASSGLETDTPRSISIIAQSDGFLRKL